MKFKLTFDMDNAAFDEYSDGEVERILTEVSSRVIDGRTESVIMDINGNKIGSWEIETD